MPCSLYQVLLVHYKYLGNNVRSEKVDAIRNIPIPKCVKCVRSLLGARRFYRNYLQIVEPLVNLRRRKNVKLNLTMNWQVAFEKIKSSLTEIPFLSFRDPNKPYYLYTNCSVFTLGACLTQKYHENEPPDLSGEKPVFSFRIS